MNHRTRWESRIDPRTGIASFWMFPPGALHEELADGMTAWAHRVKGYYLRRGMLPLLRAYLAARAREDEV